ncbi:MAG: hypothetical protein RL219_1282 [Actinomycetota bacterium]
MARKSVRSITVVVAGVALVASACGGGGGGSASVSAKERPYVDAIAQAISEDDTFPGGSANADCLAAGIVDIIGVDKLVEANVTPEDLGGSDSLNLSVVGEKRVDELVDFLLDGPCVDLSAVMAESITAEAGGQISDKQAKCVSDKVLKQDGFRAVLKQSLLGTADDSQTMDALGDVFGFLSECGVSLSDLGS